MSRRARSTPAPAAQIALLVDALDRAWRGPSWHGSSLKSALKGLTPAAALWRPAPGRHCVWDLLLHAAYWKFTARKRLLRTRIAFPREGRDFPALPAPANIEALGADLRLLDEEHARLRAAVLQFDPQRLGEKRGRFPAAAMLLGVAAHDLYHAGQVKLLLRLREGGATVADMA